MIYYLKLNYGKLENLFFYLLADFHINLAEVMYFINISDSPVLPVGGANAVLFS